MWLALLDYCVISKAYGIPFIAGLAVNQQVLLGISESLAATVSVISNALVSTTLGYALTLGKFGAPRLGASGLGYAFAGSALLHFVATTAYLRGSKSLLPYRLFTVDFTGGWIKFKEIAKQGAFIGLQVGIEVIGLSGVSILVGRMGSTQSLAAQQAVLPYVWIFITPAMATAEAMGGYIAEVAEKSSSKNVRRLGNVSIALCTGVSLAGLFIFCTAAKPMASFLLGATAGSDTSETLSLAEALFITQGVGLVFDSIKNMVIGLLRSLQNNRTPGLVALLSTGLGLPLGYALGSPVGWKANGVYIARDAVIAISSGILLHRWSHKSRHISVEAPVEEEEKKRTGGRPTRCCARLMARIGFCGSANRSRGRERCKDYSSYR